MNDSVNVIGAGQCGTLLAITLARMELKVDVFERFDDPRIHDAEAGRSINLALAARGINGLRRTGIHGEIEPLLVPMRGRMVHHLDGTTEFLPYGQRANEEIYSVTRGGLNQVLLDCAERDPNIDLHFRQQAIGFDAPDRTVHMRNNDDGSLYQVEAQPLFAADGAGSVIRRSFDGSDTFGGVETLLRHGYKELSIPAGPGGRCQDQGQNRLRPVIGTRSGPDGTGGRDSGDGIYPLFSQTGIGPVVPIPGSNTGGCRRTGDLFWLARV